jgi:hypothetical protein
MGTVGRPTKYNKRTVALICAELAKGKALRTVCNLPGLPHLDTVFEWLHTHPEFAEQYARAKQESADAMAEEVLYLSDHTKTGTVIVTKENGQTEVRKGDMLGHRKLQIDTRKWLMAKMKPKRYGDRLDVTSGDEPLPTPIVALPIKDSK